LLLLLLLLLLLTPGINERSNVCFCPQADFSSRNVRASIGSPPLRSNHALSGELEVEARVDLLLPLALVASRFAESTVGVWLRRASALMRPE
jgi:hypothetical protein